MYDVLPSARPSKSNRDIKFGNTLPSGSTCPGDIASRLSESQGLAGDSCSFSFNNSGNINKPLRRAQIFDKGVDASMMQVGAAAPYLVHVMVRPNMFSTPDTAVN